jgi:hypothetical protein
VHQNAADDVVQRASALVLAHIRLVKDAYRSDFTSVKGELGRIVQHEGEGVHGCQPIARGLKMSGQNLSLADTVVGEKNGTPLCALLGRRGQTGVNCWPMAMTVEKISAP